MSGVGTFSRRTRAILALGVALALSVQMLVMSGLGGESVTTAISDFGGILVVGMGALGTPCRFVMAGAAFLASADTVYQWLEWQGLYQSGHIVDLGWMLGYVLIAVGASTMQDLLVPLQSPS